MQEREREGRRGKRRGGGEDPKVREGRRGKRRGGGEGSKGRRGGVDGKFECG